MYVCFGGWWGKARESCPDEVTGLEYGNHVVARCICVLLCVAPRCALWRQGMYVSVCGYYVSTSMGSDGEAQQGCRTHGGDLSLLI